MVSRDSFSPSLCFPRSSYSVLAYDQLCSGFVDGREDLTWVPHQACARYVSPCGEDVYPVVGFFPSPHGFSPHGLLL